jgi:uncharacterized protein YndB with AHSA1/START domain
MVGIHHRIGIKAPVAQVYAALSTVEGVAAWWTTATTGESRKDGEVTVSFTTPTGEERGRMTFEIVELERYQKVHWRFKAGPDEWVGTDVTFELSERDGLTIVLFSHANWRELVEFTSHCSMKWATFLLSLKEWVQTGAGRPSPYDLKIDDWN